ncbi:LacI family DNA-binding transcriptional regulator [Pseudoalteromonas aurantia]|uniref:LacI family transcriptional regulator n=1 Tax=Pseudoalteromonas aurantia TaxID=43654 RepID=A0A5S3UYA1_9GAMM|nr:LacI family DNA-binding transcriptional regulator [Pseudoalteromonas aurantia]TMO62485.1 LacI family transcriptional regulator [Pseudoalteromonas aurantia]TMO62512.1 LacI family transcriptional regulator [Pseudoalteromonas aurantia]TMO76412.1 LacI family transcriptional regulator [Pseudoalteromonas aurantia]
MDKKKRVTSYDVAKAAGVSQSAVSRVFLKGRSVSKKTREKVLTTANELGYKPNAIARMLITKRSGMVAVILSSRANINYPEVLSLLNKRLAECNERVLLFNLDDSEGLDEILEQIWTFQVDGVIALAAHFDNESIEKFKDHNIPVVLYNRVVLGQTASSVCVNHEQGIFQLVTLLDKQAHKDYLVLAGPTESDVANERLECAIKALSAKGHKDVPILYGDYSYDSGKQAFHQWMKDNKAPTAVVCSNDPMAIGVIDEARRNWGLRVPEDLSVVGFDGVSAVAWHSYQLTTVKQPLELMTKAAVDILLEQIETPDNPAQLRVWSGSLIEGNTVGPANPKT